MSDVSIVLKPMKSTDIDWEKIATMSMYSVYKVQYDKVYQATETPTIYNPDTLEPADKSYIVKCDDGKFRKMDANLFYTLSEWRELQIKKLGIG